MLRHAKDLIKSYFEEYMPYVMIPLDDALFVTTEIGEFDTKRILVVEGSSRNVLFLDAFASIDRSKKELRRWTSL